jgi:hypothetical protein
MYERTFTGEQAWGWRSERISNSDIPSENSYFWIRGTFIDKDGNRFTDTIMA